MKPFKRRIFLLLGFLLISQFMGTILLAQTNKYEAKVIKEGITATFNELIQMWKEELYFEMYEFGQMKSKGTLSKVEFAQRMVDLKWKPTVTETKIENIQIIYRNFTAINCVMEFENKVNLNQKVTKRMNFPTILEKGKWKFDLLQIIRVTFSGKEYVPSAPKEKKVIKPDEKKETTSEVKENEPTGTEAETQPTAEEGAQPEAGSQ